MPVGAIVGELNMVRTSDTTLGISKLWKYIVVIPWLSAKLRKVTNIYYLKKKIQKIGGGNMSLGKRQGFGNIESNDIYTS